MQKVTKFPWSGCGTNKEICGCRFSLSVMSDDYVKKILDALDMVDTSNVYSTRDILSTTYRGHQTNVLNTVQEVFMSINDFKTHITLEATLSMGCPGDTEDEIPLELVEIKKEKLLKKFPVHCKFSFYPMGDGNYMDYIAYIVNKAIDLGLYVGPSHYATMLYGDVDELFKYFHEITKYAHEFIDHFIYQISLSINSPSAKK